MSLDYLKAARGKTPGSHTTPQHSSVEIKPSQQPHPQQQQPQASPAVGDEGEVNNIEVEVEDDGGDLPYEDHHIHHQINNVERGKRNAGWWSRLAFADADKENDFWVLFVITTGPAGLSNLGRTCAYFSEKLLTDDFWGLFQSSPIIKPVVNILVETAVDNAGEKILTLPITSLKQPYQKQLLVEYWLKILSKAEQERPKNNKDAKIDATLNGGFNIESGTGKNTQPIVYLQDLSVVHKVLNAIGQLLNRKNNFVKIPYHNGNIILSLSGRGGRNLSLNVKAGKDNVKALFALEDFANQSRKIAKKFVSLVGYCEVYLRRPSNESTSDKEKWILNVLAHDSLNQDLIQIRNKLEAGIVPGSELPAHFQKKIDMTKKKQNQDDIENADIMELITLNLPDSWKEATEAAVRLHKTAEGQRENEKLERQARKEREKLEAEEEKKRKENELKNLGEEQSAPVVKKPKTKVIKKVDGGWVSNAVVDEEGNELEKQKPKAEEKAPKVKQQTTVTAAKKETSNNIYDLEDNEEDDLPTQSEYQASLQARKGQQQQPAKKQVRKPVEKNKENGEKKEKKPKEEKKKAPEKPKNRGVEGRRQPPPVATVSILQNELIRPLFYVFLFVTLISVLYLVLN